MAVPSLARPPWSPHAEAPEQGMPQRQNREARRQQLHGMKQAILDKLLGLPMERDDDMVGFLGWVNSFVDRGLTAPAQHAMATERRQLGLNPAEGEGREGMQHGAENAGLQRLGQRGGAAGAGEGAACRMEAGRVGQGGSQGAQGARERASRSEGTRTEALTKKDSELISMLLEFSSKAAAEQSQSAVSSSAAPMAAVQSSGHTSPEPSTSPAHSPRARQSLAPAPMRDASSPPGSPRRPPLRPPATCSGGAVAPSGGDVPPPMPAPFCRDPSLDEKLAKEEERAAMGAGLSAQNMMRRRGMDTWGGLIAKRPRKTEEGCRVMVTVDRRQLSVVVAKVTQHFTYYMEPAATRMPTGVRAGRWMYYSGAIAYGTEYTLSKREIFMGQVVSARNGRPTRGIAGVVRYMGDVSRNAALMLDLEHETFYLVSMASLDDATGTEHLGTEDMNYVREKVAQWITSPLRATDTFPQFSPPPARPGPSDPNKAEPQPMLGAVNNGHGYRPPEGGGLADVFALARTAAAASGGGGYHAPRPLYSSRPYPPQPPSNYTQAMFRDEQVVPMDSVSVGGGYNGRKEPLPSHPHAYGMPPPWQAMESGGSSHAYAHSLRGPHLQAALYHHGR